MPFTIFVTQDFDQLSQVSADLVEADIREKQAVKKEFVLGLATGNSPTGLYKHLAKAFNAGRMDSGRIRSFNLDEYVGLPGENAQQRALNCESYGYFMIAEFFGLLQKKFIETNVPWGTLVEQAELVKAMEKNGDQYEMQGADKGKAVVIKKNAAGILKMIRQEILEAYEKKIESVGGIDLQVIGVGGRGHVAFHESGIPFEGNQVLLVKLDDNTVANAVQDGHFPSKEKSPWYAISMGAELVYRARKVVLLASGKRKTGPIAESVLGGVTCDVPISYGQRYAAQGGKMIYVLDEDAATDLLAQRKALEAKGYELIDMRGKPYARVESLVFARNPATNLMG